MAKSEIPSYQALNAELEQVLAALQNPDVHIDKAVALYERGLKLVRQLDVHIKATENKIIKLKLEADTTPPEPGQ